MPCYNNIEPWQYPGDFANIIQFRNYLDKTSEIMAMKDQVSNPPRWVKLSPRLLNDFIDWADTYKAPEDTSAIRPFGQKIWPGWVNENKFKDLEEFYQHYTILLKEE